MRIKFFVMICVFVSFSVHAESLYLTQTLQNWPTLSLKHMFTSQPGDFVEFEEADFISLKQQALENSEPLVATAAKKNFDESFNTKADQTKWRLFMGAVSGSRVSGFSQGIGMTKVLIDGELYLDAQIEHMNYNYKNKYLDKHYSGERYGLGTSLHWFPSDSFSLHLGVSGLTPTQ